MRLLAEHHGQDVLNIFDTLVKPWYANAMGSDLAELRYDKNLSHMQIVSLPQVHGAAVLVNKENLNLIIHHLLDEDAMPTSCCTSSNIVFARGWKSLQQVFG